VLLLHLATRSAAEAVSSRGRYSAYTRLPGARGATRHGDDVDYAGRELPVVRHSHQDRPLGRARHEAESLAEMIIGCRGAVNSSRVLVVRCLRSKIIKREDLRLARVSGWAVLERCGDCQSCLGVTQSRRCQDYAAPELITRLGCVCDIRDVLSQSNARSNRRARGRKRCMPPASAALPMSSEEIRTAKWVVLPTRRLSRTWPKASLFSGVPGTAEALSLVLGCEWPPQGVPAQPWRSIRPALS
jgi:hypothetical protein